MNLSNVKSSANAEFHKIQTSREKSNQWIMDVLYLIPFRFVLLLSCWLFNDHEKLRKRGLYHHLSHTQRRSSLRRLYTSQHTHFPNDTINSCSLCFALSSFAKVTLTTFYSYTFGVCFFCSHITGLLNFCIVEHRRAKRKTIKYRLVDEERDFTKMTSVKGKSVLKIIRRLSRYAF